MYPEASGRLLPGDPPLITLLEKGFHSSIHHVHGNHFAGGFIHNALRSGTAAGDTHATGESWKTGLNRPLRANQFIVLENAIELSQLLLDTGVECCPGFGNRQYSDHLCRGGGGFSAQEVNFPSGPGAAFLSANQFTGLVGAAGLWKLGCNGRP